MRGWVTTVRRNAIWVVKRAHLVALLYLINLSSGAVATYCLTHALAQTGWRDVTHWTLAQWVTLLHGNGTLKLSLMLFGGIVIGVYLLVSSATYCLVMRISGQATKTSPTSWQYVFARLLLLRSYIFIAMGVLAMGCYWLGNDIVTIVAALVAIGMIVRLHYGQGHLLDGQETVFSAWIGTAETLRRAPVTTIGSWLLYWVGVVSTLVIQLRVTNALVVAQTLIFFRCALQLWHWRNGVTLAISFVGNCQCGANTICAHVQEK